MADINIKVGADTREADAALGKVLNTLKQFGGIVIGGSIARDLAILTIEATTLTNKLLSVSNNLGEANTKFNILADTAIKTNSNIGGTVDLFQKLSASSIFAGSSTEALAKVTERFNMTLQISGASGAAAASSLYQFAQSMQKGVLDGDEFRNMAEQNGEILRVLERQLGKTSAEIRQMSEEGRLTAGMVATSLSNDTAILEKFAKTTLTIPQAFENLQTRMMLVLKTINDFTGATSIIANSLGGIAVAAVLALAAAFVILDIAALPWILAAAAVTAGVIALGIAFQKIYDGINSTVSVWNQFTALLDNTTSKVAKWLGIQHEISKVTEETNEKLAEEAKSRTNIDKKAADGLVVNYQRVKAATDLDKSLNDQILT